MKFQNIHRRFAGALLACLQALLLLWGTGCSIRYSFTGASIPPAARTFSVKTLPNLAPVVLPTLSAEFTDALIMKMVTSTRLSQAGSEEGDLNFEGEITGYAITQQAITANEIAAQNRLTITVHIKFANSSDPAQDYDKTFSQYEDYDSQINFGDIEQELVKTISDKLIEDIFNAALANW